jgi:hypothetical protein
MKTQIHVLLGNHIIEEIKAYANRNGLGFSEAVRWCIINSLKQVRDENGSKDSGQAPASD